MNQTQQILRDDVISINYENNLINNAKITKIAAAKINLNLKILGKRQDNFHELETVMQSISLHDTITIFLEPLAKLKQDTNKQILLEIKSNLSSPQTNELIDLESNLIYKAAKIFLEKFGIEAKIKIICQKQIPIAAGLAGGSTDAAATLKGLSALFNYFFIERKNKEQLFSSTRKIKIKLNELIPLAEQLGADVPFCLFQGTALCKGKGEIILPLNSFSEKPMILYYSAFPVYTAEAFKQLNAKNYQETTIDTKNLIRQYNQHLLLNLSELNHLWQNDFADYLLTAYPKFREIIKIFEQTGAKLVRFSGSGPTIFAMYSDFSTRDKALKDLSKKNLAGEFILCHSLNSR